MLLTLARHDPIVTLTLNDPSRRNALTGELKDELLYAVERLSSDRLVRVVILTGAGENFCAGGDLRSMDGLSPLEALARTDLNARLVNAICEAPQVFIAAVEGWTAGGGLSLASLCDIIVASRTARFVAGFSAVGLIPDLGCLWTLPRRIGTGRTALMVHTGAPIDADRAHAWGLVDELADAGAALATALAVAGRIAEKAPAATVAIRRLMTAAHASFGDLVAAEAGMQAELMTTADAAEGRRAFFEKRKPEFTRG